MKIQDLIFSRRETVKLELLFSIFSIWSKGSNSSCHVSFLRKTTIGVSYFYGNVNKKSESLRSLIKERAFINSSATTRKSKQKLM